MNRNLHALTHKWEALQSRISKICAHQGRAEDLLNLKKYFLRWHPILRREDPLGKSLAVWRPTQNDSTYALRQGCTVVSSNLFRCQAHRTTQKQGKGLAPLTSTSQVVPVRGAKPLVSLSHLSCLCLCQGACICPQ